MQVCKHIWYDSLDTIKKFDWEEVGGEMKKAWSEYSAVSNVTSSPINRKYTGAQLGGGDGRPPTIHTLSLIEVKHILHLD